MSRRKIPVSAVVFLFLVCLATVGSQLYGTDVLVPYLRGNLSRVNPSGTRMVTIGRYVSSGFPVLYYES